MMWVIRAGRDSLYFEKYIRESKVFIPWDGYKTDLSIIKSLPEFKCLVKKEKGTNNCTSISNWAVQLYSFVNDVNDGDYVLVPAKGSRTYCLAEIDGCYKYDKNDKDKLYHSRHIKIITKDIPKGIFTQPIIYSLGAFRTIFKVKQESEIIEIIKNWRVNQK